MNKGSAQGMERKKGVLVVKIIFGHLAPEILQPWACVRPFLYRFYIMDLAFIRRTDEGRRRVISVKPRSGCRPGAIRP